MGTTPLAILTGAAAIAVAILVINHWQVMPSGYQGTVPFVYRLNRWTGVVDVCTVDPNTMRNPNSFEGAQFSCVVK
jgi:hypothetical protein